MSRFFQAAGERSFEKRGQKARVGSGKRRRPRAALGDGKSRLLNLDWLEERVLLTGPTIDLKSGGLISNPYIQNKDTPPQLIAPMATVTNLDVSKIDKGFLTVRITSNNPTGDQLAVVKGNKIDLDTSKSPTAVTYLSGNQPITIGSISQNGKGNPLTVQFTAQATAAAVQALAEQIAYQNTTPNPDSSVTVQFSVNDDGVAGDTFTTPMQMISIIAAPVVTLASGTTQYMEKDPAVILAPNTTVEDLAPLPFGQGSLKVSIGTNNTDFDSLSIMGGDITLGSTDKSGNTDISYKGSQIGTFTGGAGTSPLQVTFTNATLDAVQALLNAVSYSNTTFDPVQTVVAEFVLTDDANGTVSTPAERTVEITGIKDQPSVKMPDNLPSISVGTSLPIAGIQVDDPDAGTDQLTVDLTVLKGKVSVDQNVMSGVPHNRITVISDTSIDLQGTINELNATLATTEYLGSAIATDAISVSVFDPGHQGNTNPPESASRTVSITVTSGVQMALTVAPNVNSVVVGEHLVYTITLTNSGDHPAAGVTIVDTLAPDVDFISATGTIPGTFSDGKVTFAIGALASDKEDNVVTEMVEVRPRIAAESDGTLINTVSVTSDRHGDDPTSIPTMTPVGFVQITLKDGSVKETDHDPAMFTVSLQPQSLKLGRSIVVNVGQIFINGSQDAVNPVNYVASLPTALTLSDAQSSATVSVTAVDDLVIDNDTILTLQVTLASPNAALPGTASQTMASLRIVDDDLGALIVTKTTDDGSVGTLRQAIDTSNKSKSRTDKTITFRIADVPPIIHLTEGDLPTIMEPVTIDASLSPGFKQQPILDGQGKNQNGLTFMAASSKVIGLDIENFTGYGVLVMGPGGDQIAGNILQGNTQGGIHIDGSQDNTVGGPHADDGNVIIKNTGPGIFIDGPGATGNIVQRNEIGIDLAGTSQPNTSDGVRIFSGAGNNTIGAALAITDDMMPGSFGNVIAFNSGVGVSVDSAAPNVIRGNSLFQNGEGGISLNDGQQDLSPPMLTGASFFKQSGSATFEGTVASDDKPQTIDFYINSPDMNNPPQLMPEGKSLVKSIVLDPKVTRFTPSFTSSEVQVGSVLTATVSDADHNTSVFSAPITVLDGLTVRTTDDMGVDSLRTVLANAMKLSIPSTINFDINPSMVAKDGRWHIVLSAPLDPITKTVVINGYSQSQMGFNSSPNTVAIGDNARIGIVLDGMTPAGTNLAQGLEFMQGADGSDVKGLDIQNFQTGIVLAGGSGYKIDGNFIGTDPSGTSPRPNTEVGILIADGVRDVTIGGPSVGDRNVISGNQGTGIEFLLGPNVSSTGAATPFYTTENNYIGTDVNGNASLGNEGDGVSIQLLSGLTIATAVTIADNSIASNLGYGIHIAGAPGTEISGSGITIAGNQLGTDATGTITTGLGNGMGGVFLENTANATIGGTTIADGNTIAGNRGAAMDPLQGHGILVQDGSMVLIEHNVIGTNAAGGPNKEGTKDLGNAKDGINATGTTGLIVLSNLVAGNGSNGIEVVGGDPIIADNFVGVNRDNTGGMALRNEDDGLLLVNTPSAIVGSVTRDGQTVPGNIVGNNGKNGIEIRGKDSTGVLVAGNAVGTDRMATGSVAMGNVLDGIRVDSQIESGNIPSLNLQVETNWIAGNGANGLELIRLAGTVAAGNYVGVNPAFDTDSQVLARLRNGANGVLLDRAPSTTIGGAPSVVNNAIFYDRNFIGNNGLHGIKVMTAGSSDVVIKGNSIGTDRTGAIDLGNGASAAGDGVLVMDAPRVTVTFNLISGNQGAGVELSSAMNAEVSDNLVGVNRDGTIAQRNLQGGVLIEGTVTESVSGVIVSGNTISANAMFGLRAVNTSGLMITGNQVGINASEPFFALPNGGAGVSLSASSGSIVRNNTLAGNGGDGLSASASPNLQVEGNAIGTALDVTSLGGTIPAGTFLLPNAGAGIRIVDSSNVTIGGSATGDRNLIVNNMLNGIDVTGSLSSGLRVQENYIGVAFDGATAMDRGNGGDGLHLVDAKSATVLDNTIARNRMFGVELAGNSDATLQQNLIGTNPKISQDPDHILEEGTLQLGNTMAGVHVTDSAQATIGAKANSPTPDADGNIIVNNHGDGVLIDQSSSAYVRANFIGTNKFIGTDRNAAVGLGNSESGVRVLNASGVMIVSNTIAGNIGNGVYATSASKLHVQDNGIGTDQETGRALLGNRLVGILIGASPFAKDVNDSTEISGNTVGANGQGGIQVTSDDPSSAPDSFSVKIEGNRIGTSVDGRMPNPNVGDGIRIDNLCHPQLTKDVKPYTITVTGNLVSSNEGDGISISAVQRSDGGPTGITLSGNTLTNNAKNGVEVQKSFGAQLIGNMIGTDLGHSANLGNRLDGVLLDGATSSIIGDGSYANNPDSNYVDYNKGNGVEIVGTSANNMIAGNIIDDDQVNGVRIAESATYNTVQQNAIGTDSLAQSDLGNLANGVLLSDSGVANNKVAANRISANRNSGVMILGGATRNHVYGNTVGVGSLSDRLLTVDLGNRNDGITLLQAGVYNDITANTIAGNSNNGILVSNTNWTVIHSNVIGTLRTGTDAQGNVDTGNANVGVLLDNSGSTTLVDNTISRNKSNGVVISGVRSVGNLLRTNRIGTDPTGTLARGNKLDGVLLVSATGNYIGIEHNGNVVSGNESNGIVIFQGGQNHLISNSIGTDQSGLIPLANKGDGVLIIDSSSNSIGGSAAGQNTISANQLSGVEILGNLQIGGQSAASTTGATPALQAMSNQVTFNLIGTSSPGKMLGNSLDGVRISGSTKTTTDNVVAGNTIAANIHNGISINNAASTIVSGNTIGKAKGLGNGVDGVNLENAPSTQVRSANAIAYNGQDGVDLFSTSLVTVQGNTIFANGSDGVRIEESSQGNAIGAAGTGTVNYITDNGVAGIQILSGSVNNDIFNNWIGIGRDQTTSGKQPVGVLLSDVVSNRIGGASWDVRLRNVIAGNSQAGIQIEGGGANIIRFNLIGTDVNGESAGPGWTLGNLFHVQPQGLFIDNSVLNDVVRNVISGNDLAGVEIDGASSGNMVHGNRIGTDLGTPAGNDFVVTKAIVTPVGGVTSPNVFGASYRQDDGVHILNASGNLIGLFIQGNTLLHDANVIMGNQTGVHLEGLLANNNWVSSNQIGPNPDPSVDGTDMVVNPFKPRLGNFAGVVIDRASQNVLSDNAIQRNISAGVEILGAQSTNNSVQRNNISWNGATGYTLNVFGGVQGRTDNSGIVQLATPVLDQTKIYGVGIYIDAGSSNTIGGPSVPPTSPLTLFGSSLFGNIVDNNVLVGIYLVDGARNNPIMGNRVHGGGAGHGEYGVFLFDSAANLTAVQQNGKFQNDIRGNYVADFREYTGPGPSAPQLYELLDQTGRPKKGPQGPLSIPGVKAKAFAFTRR